MNVDFIPGADLPETFAAVDAALDSAQIKTTATRIIETYRRLVTDPANHAETAECVPLRLIRAALATEPREYFDAALRWLDTQPSGQPSSEITYMGKPTAADMAAAVFVAAGGEHYMANLVWFDVPAT
jgi:hypothetical protein